MDKTPALQYQDLQFESSGFQDLRSNHHERHLGDTSKINKKIRQKNGSVDSREKINFRLHAKVVEFRRVGGELQGKGRQCVVACRGTWRGWVPGLGDSRVVACQGVVTLTERLVTAWI